MAAIIILDCIIIMLQNFCHKLQIVLATLEPEACQLIHKETPTFLEIVVAFHIAYHRRKNEISRLKKLVKFTAPTKINSIAKRVALQTDSKDSTDAWKPQNDAWKLVSVK